MHLLYIWRIRLKETVVVSNPFAHYAHRVLCTHVQSQHVDRATGEHIKMLMTFKRSYLMMRYDQAVTLFCLILLERAGAVFIVMR